MSLSLAPDLSLGSRRIGASGPVLIPAPFASVNGPTQGPSAGPYESWSAEYAGTPVVANPDGVSPTQFDVTRQGFDATGNAISTTVDRFTVTSRVRQPYPNQAGAPQPHTVALSDYIYSTDTVAGTATNNSTFISPKAVGNWAMPDRAVVGNSLAWEVVAGHRNARGGKQIACAIPRVTGKIAGVTTTVTYAAVSTITKSTSCPMDYGSVLVLGSTLDVSNFDDTQQLTLNVKLYPIIGAAASVYDSGDGTFTARKDFSPRYFYRHTSKAASPPVIYVSSTGNNSTAVVSTNDATARANPALTFKGAITKVQAFGACDGLEIRCQAGSWMIDGPASGTLTQAVGWMKFTRDPLVAKNLVTLTFGSSAMDYLSINTGLTNTPNTSAVIVDDVQVVRTAGFKFYIGTVIRNELFWRNVTFDNGGFSGTYLDLGDDYIFGMTLTGASGNFLGAAAAGQHRIQRGLSMTSSGTIEVSTMLGCNIPGANSFTPSNGLTCEGQVICFNKLDGNTGELFVAQDPVTYGVLWDQNETAFISTTADAPFAVSNDAKTNNTKNVLMRGNTLAGAWVYGRWNVFYDWLGTARTNILHDVRGNIIVQINTKGDVAQTDGTRLGNWAFLYGVGCQGNFSQYIDANSGGLGTAFAQAYPGLGCNIGTSSTVTNDPKFTTPQATTWNGSTATAGTVGGDYSVQVSSPCKAMMASAVWPFDLLGNARLTTLDTTGARA